MGAFRSMRPARRGVWVGTAAALIALAVLATGCGNVQRSLGLEKTPPDEFAVVRNAPLTLPPDYQLRPPSPGAPRPTEATLRHQAATAVFEGNGGGRRAVGAGNETTGELALLQQADALDADPAIRQKVDRDFSVYVEEQDGFFESLLFWREEGPLGDVVDAESESRRLRENAALGRPVTEGETPTIERREKALLEGIF